MRIYDAERINYLVNHPEIRPFVGGDITKSIDLTASVQNPADIYVGGDHGAFGCSFVCPGVYEVHTFILPEGRGKWACEFAKAALAYVAEQGARYLWTCVHPDHANVKFFTLRSGFKRAGQVVRDLGVGPVTYDIFDWRA